MAGPPREHRDGAQVGRQLRTHVTVHGPAPQRHYDAKLTTGGRPAGLLGR